MSKDEKRMEKKKEYLEFRNDLLKEGFTKEEALEYLYYQNDYDYYDNHGTNLCLFGMFFGMGIGFAGFLENSSSLFITGIAVTAFEGLAAAICSWRRKKHVSYQLMNEIDHKVEIRTQQKKQPIKEENVTILDSENEVEAEPVLDENRFQYGTDGKMYDIYTGAEVLKENNDKPKIKIRK